MAVTPLQDLVNKLVARELSPSRRYRCLVLQTERLDQQARLHDCLPAAINALGWQCGVLPWDRFFDTVGALSSDTARDLVLATGNGRAVILPGPLHYVDYWTAGVQEGFWSFLSLYSRGPGIVVVDIPRTEGVEGPFVARGILSGTDVRFLRPRLVATEEASL